MTKRSDAQRAWSAGRSMMTFTRADGSRPMGRRELQRADIKAGSTVRWQVIVKRQIAGRRVAVSETFVGRVHAIDGDALTVLVCDEAPRLVTIGRDEVVG